MLSTLAWPAEVPKLHCRIVDDHHHSASYLFSYQLNKILSRQNGKNGYGLTASTTAGKYGVCKLASFSRQRIFLIRRSSARRRRLGLETGNRSDNSAHTTRLQVALDLGCRCLDLVSWPAGWLNRSACFGFLAVPISPMQKDSQCCPKQVRPLQDNVQEESDGGVEWSSKSPPATLEVDL